MKIKRKIVKIDEKLCNGCGQCIISCHENAIQIINNKAKIMIESMCDGLGDCLGTCPADAITIEEREAEPYNAELVIHSKKEGCPGSITSFNLNKKNSAPGNWPLKIRLVRPDAQFLNNTDLIIAADCTAFAQTNFHAEFTLGNPVIIGCPKFDERKMLMQKLIDIFKHSSLKSCSVIRMSVPCCSGLLNAVRTAASAAGVNIEIKDTIINI